MLKVHTSHKVWMARQAGVPVLFCSKCGGVKTGAGRGLQKACCDMSGPKARLDRIWSGIHPYNRRPMALLGPAARWAMDPMEEEVREPEGHEVGLMDMDVHELDPEEELAMYMARMGQDEDDPFGHGMEVG